MNDLVRRKRPDPRQGPSGEPPAKTASWATLAISPNANLVKKRACCFERPVWTWGAATRVRTPEWRGSAESGRRHELAGEARECDDTARAPGAGALLSPRVISTSR